MLAIGFLALAIFVVIDMKVAKIPMIPPRIFGRRTTAIQLLQAALYKSVWQIDLYFLPI